MTENSVKTTKTSQRVTKSDLKETLRANLDISNAILRDPAALADKPQVLIKYMEYRHKAMTMLFDLNSEGDEMASLESENERLRRRILSLEHELKIIKEKNGIISTESAVDAGSLHDSRPDRPRRDPTETHADPVGFHRELVSTET